jgi:hypothetical protein
MADKWYIIIILIQNIKNRIIINSMLIGRIVYRYKIFHL